MSRTGTIVVASHCGHGLRLPAIRYAWAILLSATTVAHGTEPPAAVGREVVQRACAALNDRVGRLPAPGPVLLRSYDDARGSGEPDDAVLRSAAFTYDNALAVIALLACDRRAQALRVGEALRMAAVSDSRLRNAYRAGPVAEKPLPNGWWDADKKSWLEDAYQAGAATGNVAWVALALLALHDETGQARWLEAARKLADWVVANTVDARGAGGFSGGVHGFDADPQKLLWKSTEHNVDLAALFSWLARLEPAGQWNRQALSARRFLDAQWDATSGHFLVGTLSDGITANRGTSALDVQLWPLLLRDAAHAWRRALDYAEREHGVPGGFDFNADRDGLWLEGTAQAALVYRLLGREHEADTLLATIAAQFAPGGFVYATREVRITTGLALSADSTSADFYYFRRPHLAATAWAALAATRRNPYVPAAAKRNSAKH
jgi:hypothetical protein